MATAMWRNQPPITGARINGSRERAGIAACFNDSEGKPLAIQLGANDWIPALKLLGFHEAMVAKGLDDLGISFESDEKKNQILDQLSDKEIININIPTGVPLVYTLSKDLTFVNKKYLINSDELNKRLAIVENQGKIK